MNKLEFLTRLRNRLENGGMPADDINDALTYYEEVFLDAGFGKEEETAASLGSPENIAVDLLRESGLNVDPAPSMPPQMNNPQPNFGQFAYQGAYAAAAQPVKQKSTGFTAAMVILAIFSSPIWIPLLIAVAAVLFSLIIAAISIVFALFASAIGMLFAGFFCLFEAPAIGLMFLGISLFLGGLIILITKPVFSAVIPAFGNAIKKFFNWLMGLFKKGEKTNE